MLGIIDCNNFYVSCERVFNPKLLGKPVVVLSNNDGCVIARSNEAKALKIPMGAVAFKYRAFFEENRVMVLSSNYELYADMSQRVIHTLRTFSFPLEIYSIDEVFMQFPNQSYLKLFRLGREIRKKVLKWTGIPVSIGLAPTKTLAKVANKIAKKKNGILAFPTEEEADKHLEKFPVRDIWGIGSAYSKFLLGRGISTALKFKHCPDAWVKKHLSVVGLKTLLELRGTLCYHCLESPSMRKSIVSSRSFPKEISDFMDLKAAIATFTGKAAEKLRKEGLVAGFLVVFIATNPFGKDPYFSDSFAIKLPSPTHYTPHLIAHAGDSLKRIYQKGLFYKKAGIMLYELHEQQKLQLDLFEPKNNLSKQNKIMDTFDNIKHRFGKQSVCFASEGIKKKLLDGRKKCSPGYTTNWEELFKIDID